MYVGTLGVQCRKDTAGIGSEHIFLFVVAYFADNITDNALMIGCSGGMDLTCQDNLTGGNEGFAGYL